MLLQRYLVFAKRVVQLTQVLQGMIDLFGFDAQFVSPDGVIALALPVVPVHLKMVI